MSRPQVPPPAKLICGMFARDVGLLFRAADALSRRYGVIDWQSPVLPFEHTRYYAGEFGPDLKRVFFAFSNLVEQGGLAEIKREAFRLERELSKEGRRQVNIDPGLLTAERLVLATGKNFTHRIYIGRGVFADLTLIFKGGFFRPLPWTYRDYASDEALTFWVRVRSAYIDELKRSKPGGIPS